MSVRFTWDPDKAAANARKHGVTFEEAVTVFADPLALDLVDEGHEDRMILIGQSESLRILLTVYSERMDETIRIISARRVTPHERRRYEEGER